MRRLGTPGADNERRMPMMMGRHADGRNEDDLQDDLPYLWAWPQIVASGWRSSDFLFGNLSGRTVWKAVFAGRGVVT